MLASTTPRRQSIPQNVEFLTILQRYLENLIHEVRINGEFVQRLFEHLDVHVEVHSVWTVQTDQSRVNFNVGVLPSRSRTG